MPLTTGAALVAGLGIIGVPGTAGFISKWYLAIGALDQGWWPLVFLLVASSLVSVVYVGRVIEVACFRPTAARVAEAKDPPLSMLLPLLALAAATIYLGLDTRFSVGLASGAAAYLLGGLR
jgi:multicomponent Na+:H+ antiporter subunit D